MADGPRDVVLIHPLYEAIRGGTLCTMLGAVALWGYVGFLLPSRTGSKILEVFSSSVVSVRVPNVYLSES